MPSLRSAFKELVADSSAEETKAKEVSEAKARLEAEAKRVAAAAEKARQRAAEEREEAANSTRVSQRPPPSGPPSRFRN